MLNYNLGERSQVCIVGKMVRLLWIGIVYIGAMGRELFMPVIII